MKKFLAVAALSLIGFWVAGVMFFGRAAAVKVDEQIARLNHHLALRYVPVSITQQSYEAGFLSSAAQILLTIEFRDKEPLLVAVDMDIFHGPIMLSPNGLKVGAYYVGATPDLTAVLSESDNLGEFLGGFEDRDPLRGGVLIDFWGGQTVDLAVAPFAFSEGGDTVVLENGIVGVFTTDDQFSSLAGSLRVGALSVADESEAVTMDIAASALTIDITEIYAGNMLTGELAYRLDHAKINAGGAEHHIKDVSMHGFSGKNESGLYGNVDIVVDSISSSDESFTAVFDGPLTARLDMNYEGLDEQAIREYADINQKLNQEVYGRLLLGDVATGMEELSEEDVQAYVLAMVGLVKQGFTFDYGISVGQGGSNSGFNFTVDWVDSEALMHKKTLREALAGIQANLKIGIDKAFLRGNEQLVQMPVGMGYAVETPTGIESEAQFNRGELLLNGQTIPYTQMIGAGLDQELPWRAW